MGIAKFTLLYLRFTPSFKILYMQGTQSPLNKDEYFLCHLATGDILRAAVAAGTDIGKKVKSTMESGALVTDEIVVGIIKDAIKSSECRRGFILDDFPRTVVQAKKVRTRGDTDECPGCNAASDYRYLFLYVVLCSSTRC